MQPEKIPHARLEVMKVQSAHMPFAIMDEKQCSDRGLKTICVQDLRRSGGGIDIVLEVDAGVCSAFRASMVQNAGPHALHGRQASALAAAGELGIGALPVMPVQPQSRRVENARANLADLAITASDHDLMDIRGDQFTDNRIASSIVRRDGNGLARFSTDGVLGIDCRPGDRCGIPCYIKRLLRRSSLGRHGR